MKYEQVLQRSQWIARPVEEVFAFFCDEKNLEKITPPFLQFRVKGKSTAEIGEGTLIWYRLRLRGIPIRWHSRIEEWSKNRRFVDRQLKGPYALWHHTHEFEPKDGGTLMKDTVRYQLPAGKFGAWLVGSLVRRDVEAIFDYRNSVIKTLFQ